MVLLIDAILVLCIGADLTGSRAELPSLPERREASTTSPPPSSRDDVQLLRDLDHPQYARREAAEKLIAEDGYHLISQLEALATRRTEAAIRAKRLVTKLRRTHLESIAKRAADGDEAAAKALPTWHRFRIPELSDDRRAHWFGRMLLAINQVEAGSEFFRVAESFQFEQKRDAFTEIYHQLIDLNGSHTAGPGRVPKAMAALLLGGHPMTGLTAEDGMRLGLLMARGDVARLLASPDDRPLAVWLVRQFAENLPDDGKVHAFSTVRRFGIPNMAAMARVVAEHGVSPRPLAEAVATLSVAGDRSDLKLITPLFERPHLLSGSARIVRLNEVALYSAVVLSGQRPEDYGFAQLGADEVRGFHVQSVRFVSSAARSRAFRKWKTWEETQFRELPAPPADASVGERL